MPELTFCFRRPPHAYVFFFNMFFFFEKSDFWQIASHGRIAGTTLSGNTKNNLILNFEGNGATLLGDFGGKNVGPGQHRFHGHGTTVLGANMVCGFIDGNVGSANVVHMDLKSELKCLWANMV